MKKVIVAFVILFFANQSSAQEHPDDCTLDENALKAAIVSQGENITELQPPKR